jgi:streptomycin 6-kinase
LNLPPDFVHTVQSTFEGGGRWLRKLPETLAACARRWDLTVHPHFDLSYNFVAPATCRDGSEVVLKIGVPNPELWTEIEALRVFDGRGITRLIDVAEELGAFLTERLRPGRPLEKIDNDVQATAVAADVMKKLWKTVGEEHPFPTVGEWASGLDELRKEFEGETGPFPEKLVDRAERIFDELLSSQGEKVLLHGDLHHWNILEAERAPWLALDPKGVVGEREYEVGALLRNPYNRISSWPDLAQQTARRIDQLSELLAFDRQRLAAWNFAQAVLSAWWLYEDEGTFSPYWIANAWEFSKLVV